MTLEDPNTSLTWPSVLPSGWSMEWEPTTTSNDLEEYCHIGLTMASTLRLYKVLFKFLL